MSAEELWILGFVAVIPFADLRGAGGPIPWWGRFSMIGVSLVLAGILAGTFLSLGRPTARSHLKLLQSAGSTGA